MAEQNLFTKYGIKEVADVTFYRIEKKNQNYEVQRKIPVSSILKGVMSTQKVYPLNDEGIGDVDGFDAFVFKDADLITGVNYDCDDEILVKETYTISFNSNHTAVPELATGLGHNTLPKEHDSHTEAKGLEDAYQDFQKTGTVDWDPDESFDMTVTDFTVNRWNVATGIQLYDTDLEDYKAMEDKEETGVSTFKNTTSDGNLVLVKVEKEVDDSEEGEEKVVYRRYYKAIYTVNTVYEQTIEKETGVYKPEEKSEYPDFNKTPGTHEYSYAKQAAMIFAQEQNLITKVGTRYQFSNVDSLFGDIVFDDAFAAAPNSSERVVVIGIDGKTTYGSYDMDEVRDAINALSTTFSVKAYEITYKNYVELVVEDEMGYYRPDFLGIGYKKKQDGTAYLATTFDYDKAEMNADDNDFHDFGHTGKPDVALKAYKDWAVKHRGIDTFLGGATMWGDQEHYSINDAIDALRQRQKNLDINIDESRIGINSIFGGYRVGKNRGTYRPRIGYTDDTKFADGAIPQTYRYHIQGTEEEANKNQYKYQSKYALQDVLDTLAQMAVEQTIDDLNVRVDIGDATASNRAIYVNTLSTGASAPAHIYILRNKNSTLMRDKDGIFEFEDMKGNTLYYQDKIFAGVKTLALVIIGSKGLIFVVNRYDTKSHDKVAWMVNDNGYLNNDEASYIVKNGLIHTVTVTDFDESFDATCEVKSMKVRRVNKTVDRYVPVLFLDTLKISTLEQTGEETYATGGKGNAQLIGWDYGKEITLSLEDALFTPASMSLMWGAGGDNFVDAVKDAKKIDSMQKVTAPRSFIVPAGNSKGVPTEGETGPEAVYINPTTMQPYQDGEPITEGEVYLKWTRSVAYEGQSIGKVIEISADKFAGTYRVVGETWIREESTGKDHKYQFVIPKAKVGSERTITLEADGDPTVNPKSNAVIKVA